MNGEEPEDIDFYALEEKWTLQNNYYDDESVGDVLQICEEVISKL